MITTVLNQKRLKAFSGILALFILLLFIICMNSYLHYHAEVEILRETSPDDNYSLTIYSVGTPRVYDSKCHVRIELYSLNADTNNELHQSFFVETAAKYGFMAHCEAEWLSSGVRINVKNSALMGRMSIVSYISPF